MHADPTDRDQPGHVAGPFNGVVSLRVEVGDRVRAGDPLATIEAMKTESTISAPVDGVVDRVAVGAHLLVAIGST